MNVFLFNIQFPPQGIDELKVAKIVVSACGGSCQTYQASLMLIGIYTRYLSSCLFVGCTRSPRSHSLLCSRGFTPLPSRCILKSIGYTLMIKYSIPFILQVAALLAAFTHPSHIVIYAPGDSFTCRCAATRNLLGI
ncbi:conserved hypothetical protein [Photorhabdus asymbiotica]|uniref:Uncharacterized protein n=1 Tax=Photorhabdus asymbiotica subsp. asymbiotica (strain ATCC 43949 / 3105-77) TaxID=553480 RepID=C7BI91_PHOAA|nr:conserved hypothetical protein [Photorhabdus asymbiotica]